MLSSPAQYPAAVSFSPQRGGFAGRRFRAPVIALVGLLAAAVVAACDAGHRIAAPPSDFSSSVDSRCLVEINPVNISRQHLEDFEPLTPEEEELGTSTSADDGPCEAMYRDLIRVCKHMPRKVDRAQCYIAAMMCYAECLADPPPCRIDEYDVATGVCIGGVPPGGGGGGGGGSGGECVVCQEWFMYEDGEIVDHWWDCAPCQYAE